jgi:hypothetical protein
VELAASAFEWVQAVGGVVAALAALGTLVFLWLTVRGANALARAERRAHLLDLAADYAAAGIAVFTASVRKDTEAWSRARITGERFRAALDSTSEALPACRRLLDVEWRPVAMGVDAERKFAEAEEALGAALDELSAWLRD